MSTAAHKPRVLIVDDHEDYRQSVIPKRLERLGAECLQAQDVEEACRLAEQLSNDKANPIRLVVLDMHMPASSRHANIEEDAGLQVLKACQRLQLVLDNCRIIVFTAHQSYANCVEAIKAGAFSYIPKLEQPDETGRMIGGFDELMTLCEKLLREQSGHTAVPDAAWLERNYDGLIRDFPGQWVAFVDCHTAREAGVEDVERDGLVILNDVSYETLRQRIIRSPAILRHLPPIVWVAASSAKHAFQQKEPK